MGGNSTVFKAYDQILNEDGSYKKPKDFIDQFSIHMHKNMLQAFEGMSGEEILKAEECLEHSVQEFAGKVPQLRRHA